MPGQFRHDAKFNLPTFDAMRSSVDFECCKDLLSMTFPNNSWSQWWCGLFSYFRNILKCFHISCISISLYKHIVVSPVFIKSAVTHDCKKHATHCKRFVPLLVSSYQISYHHFQRILSSRKQEKANIYSTMSWVLAVEFGYESSSAGAKPAQIFHIHPIHPLSATMGRDYINHFFIMKISCLSECFYILLS